MISSSSGSIDHVSLWKGALTSAEVLDDFEAVNNPPSVRIVNILGEDIDSIMVESSNVLNTLINAEAFDPDNDNLNYRWIVDIQGTNHVDE